MFNDPRTSVEMQPPDLPKSHCARSVTVRLLNTSSSRGRLPGSLSGQLLPGNHRFGLHMHRLLNHYSYLGALPPVDLRAVCLVLAIVAVRRTELGDVVKEG